MIHTLYGERALAGPPDIRLSYVDKAFFTTVYCRRLVVATGQWLVAYLVVPWSTL